MKRKTIKELIKWAFMLIIAHLATMLIFGLVVSSSVARVALDDPLRARTVVFWIGLILQAFFVLIYSKFLSRFGDTDYRREFRAAVKNENVSVLEFYRSSLLIENLLKLVVFAVFQIPFTVFYSAFGLDLVYTTGLEQFYIMDAGAYALTNSALLGFFLNTVLFGVVFLAIQFLFLVFTRKSFDE